MRTLAIKADDRGRYICDDPGLPGTPNIGVGYTAVGALRNWLAMNADITVKFEGDVHPVGQGFTG